MKKLLLLLTLACPVITCSAQTIYDDFDDYKVDQFLGIESNGLWTTWTNSPGGSEDAYVVDDEFFSPDNSIHLESGGATDLVLPLGNHSAGSWTLSYMMYIEEGHGAYFNLLHYFSAAASNWAVQVYFNASGAGSLVVGSGASLDPGTTFVHPTGSWFEIKVNIDVDSDIAEMYFDDTPIYSWTWSEGSTGISSAIAALNLYPNGMDDEPDSYFVDNVSFHEYGMSVDDIESAPLVYPNPAKDILFVNTNNNSMLKVTDLLGKVVYQSQNTENQTLVDCASWVRGVYFVEIITDSNRVTVKRVILH